MSFFTHKNTLDVHANRRRLRQAMIAFFVLLIVPVVVLIDRVYEQSRLETYLQYRTSAQQLVNRLNLKLSELLAKEENRPFGDFQYYKISRTPLLKQNRLVESPLSNPGAESDIPGLLGYFQINPKGEFSSPLLPSGDEDLLPPAISFTKIKINAAFSGQKPGRPRDRQRRRIFNPTLRQGCFKLARRRSR